MAYEPTVWNKGDVISAEKLNKMENGIRDAGSGSGTPGAAAGFGVPTATVDDNTGVPSVEIQASGPDTAKVFAFTFKNLKGAKGDTGAQGPAGVVELATTSKAGSVKQATLVADASTDTGADLKTKINELIAALKTAGIMASQ